METSLPGTGLLRYSKPLKVVTLDSETEGLNLHYTRAWELAWLISENGVVVEEHQYFPWFKDLCLSPGAAQTTNFNAEEYKKRAVDPKIVYEKLAEILFNPEYLIVGQNILGYDIFILSNLARSVGVEPDYSYLPRVVDTYLFGKANKLHIAPIKEGGKQRLYWQYGIRSIQNRPKNCSLKGLAKEHKIEVDDTKFHGALYDCQTTNQVFQKQIWQMEIY